MSSPLPTSIRQPLFNFWGIALLLLLIMIFQLVGAFISQTLLCWAYNIDAETYDSLTRNPDFSHLSILLGRWSNFIQFVIYMGVPAVILTIVNSKSLWDISGRVDPNWRGRKFSLAVLVGISAIPVVAVLTQLMHGIQPQGKLGDVIIQLDEARTRLFENMLQMDSSLELFVVFLILALLPALFEEYLFRGLILGIGKQEFKRKGVALFFQAMVFGLLHFSFFELPGIFFMGLMFGLIAVRNGHIWFGIVAHMVFNGATVVIQYLLNSSSQKTYTHLDSLIANFSVALPAAILLGVSLFQLTRKNKHETQ